MGYTFFMLMTLFPHVQRKAHEEIVSVIGTSRLPGVKDRPSLPYVNAVLKETLRWHPPLPLGNFYCFIHPILFSVDYTGGPHEISQDEVLDGHFIKKGSICLGNIWFVFTFYGVWRIANQTVRSIMHDEKYFSDPHEFIPERHLNTGNETGATALLDPSTWIFGFGKRYVFLT
jgi:cytochrome P450